MQAHRSYICLWSMCVSRPHDNVLQQMDVDEEELGHELNEGELDDEDEEEELEEETDEEDGAGSGTEVSGQVCCGLGGGWMDGLRCKCEDDEVVGVQMVPLFGQGTRSVR